MAIVELEYTKMERIEGDDTYGKFVCEPLSAGYGTTLGNSLRRVLLSSLPGAAITAARVRGVAHEFSTIPGVKEDVVQIVLNLKQIRLRSFSNEPVTLTLEKEGPGDVTAADITTTSEIEIVNPEARIATLEPEASLWMELTVETGRGFHSADRREGLPIGVIPIDALYSPVRKVNFAVESTRVGQVTNYDRLVLEVWTDGTTTPDEAVAQGSNILVQQFSLFAGLTRSQRRSRRPSAPTGARCRRSSPTCRSRTSTCRSARSTRSSGTASPRSASCSRRLTRSCCACATSARSRSTRSRTASRPAASSSRRSARRAPRSLRRPRSRGTAKATTSRPTRSPSCRIRSTNASSDARRISVARCSRT